MLSLVASTTSYVLTPRAPNTARESTSTHHRVRYQDPVPAAGQAKAPSMALGTSATRPDEAALALRSLPEAV